MRTHSMRQKQNFAMHDHQTVWDKFTGMTTPMPWSKCLVTQMLMRELFAVNNLLAVILLFYDLSKQKFSNVTENWSENIFR